jgi:hypothetical protein
MGLFGKFTVSKRRLSVIKKEAGPAVAAGPWMIGVVAGGKDNGVRRAMAWLDE